MSRLIELELDDEVYATVQRRARAAGTSPALWVRQLLERQCIEESEPAHVTLERHFGAIDMRDTTGADNTRIDADIAREYADNHEPS